MKNQRKTVEKSIMKAAMGICTAVICICATTIYSLAYTKTTGTVVPATAKIRAEASTSSEAIGSTAAGKTLYITDEVTGGDGSTWYQVEVDGSTKGYIRADLVNKAASSTDSGKTESNKTNSTKTENTNNAEQSAASVIEPSSVTATDSQPATVATASANVRKSASTSADVISSIPKGTAVTITGKATGNDGKDWFQISYSVNGATATGFVRSDLVTTGVAETEVSGTKTAAPSKEAAPEKEAASTDTEGETPETEAGTEAMTEEGTEGTTEEQDTEGADTKKTDTGSVTVINTEETPMLPSGFQEVAVTLNGENVRAWKNGDFYIFYAQAADGTEGFYMYDSVEASYQRYFMTNVEMPENANDKQATGILKPAVIVMAVLVVILLIIITVLTIKMNEYKEELGWDEDDDDYYPDEDDDDDEEDDEEEELTRRRSVSRKAPVAQPVRRVKRVRPVVEEYEDEEEDEEEPVVVHRVQRKPVQEVRQPVRKPVASKPRNFLEDGGTERPVRRVKKRPVAATKSSEFDPEDEDTFVFINLDGEDLE